MSNDPKNTNSKTTAGLPRRFVGSASFDPNKLPDAVKERLKESARDTAPREKKKG